MNTYGVISHNACTRILQQTTNMLTHKLIIRKSLWLFDRILQLHVQFHSYPLREEVNYLAKPATYY